MPDCIVGCVYLNCDNLVGFITKVVHSPGERVLRQFQLGFRSVVPRSNLRLKDSNIKIKKNYRFQSLISICVKGVNKNQHSVSWNCLKLQACLYIWMHGQKGRIMTSVSNTLWTIQTWQKYHFLRHENKTCLWGARSLAAHLYENSKWILLYKKRR